MEDRVVVPRAAGGLAGVPGQRLWQRVCLHSLPFLLSGYTYLKVGEAERMSLLLSPPASALPGKWIPKEPT